MGELDGRVALVVGAATGIGRASALALGAAGASVVLADVNVDGLDAVQAELEGDGTKAITVRTDVSQPDQVDAMVAAAIEHFGRLDIAHNNAAVQLGRNTAVADIELDAWRRVLDIGLTGTWLCLRAEIKAMAPNKRGSIINTASIAGLNGMPGDPAYCATKHGVVGLTKAAAFDYASIGIRINAVCPGLVRAPMLQTFIDQAGGDETVFAGLAPMQRIGGPEEIAATVVWLAGDSSSYVTGVTLPVDGGLTATV